MLLSGCCGIGVHTHDKCRICLLHFNKVTGAIASRRATCADDPCLSVSALLFAMVGLLSLFVLEQLS